MTYTYAVITAVADPASGGNMATFLPTGLWWVSEPATEANDYTETLRPFDFDAALQAAGPVVFSDGEGRSTGARPLRMWDIRTPVFAVGELLVLNESGREVGANGRKPSKWFVEVEEFDNIDDAVRRAREVMEAEADRQLREMGVVE